MTKLAPLGLGTLFCAIALFTPVSTASAQCPTQGNLVFELVSVNNDGVAPGSQVTMRVIGEPLAHICLACDVGGGTTDLLGLGTACLPFSQNLIEFLLVLPDNGIAEFTVNVPPSQVETLLCCQALGLDPNAPNSLAISGRICVGVSPCDGGGVASIGHATKFNDVTSFPVTVTSAVHGRAGGSGDPSTSVDFDPDNPPVFPIDGGNGVWIESIAHIDDCLYVTTFVSASPSLSHQAHAGRLPNECDFTVSVGSDARTQSVHTSCSQPLGVGMVFGLFTITELTPH